MRGQLVPLDQYMLSNAIIDRTGATAVWKLDKWTGDTWICVVAAGGVGCIRAKELDPQKLQQGNRG